MFDRGTKFMAEFSKMCQNDYVLKMNPITTRNPQSNAIIEQIHQTIGNIIRTFDVSNIVNNNPWSGILAATMFAATRRSSDLVPRYQLSTHLRRELCLIAVPNL